MATSTTELILKFTGDPKNLKDTLAAVRADLAGSANAQVAIAHETNRKLTSEAQSETRNLTKEEQERKRAAESLQRQRSAALIAIWKQEERERKKIQEQQNKPPFSDIIQGLTQSIITIQGPLGGLASRINSAHTQFASLGESATEASSAVAAVAVPVGVAIAAVGALTVGVGLLIEKFYEATKQTAEFQGKFEDLSQQVGVSVETLSTLDVIASTTGGSIETVTASLGIFQKNLENAHDPTSREAKLLKELGVTSLDTETAFRQTVKGLFALGEGAKQTDAVLQLFGRSGRFVNAIMKESHGNLDEAAEKLRKMGLQVSTTDALIADRFNDTLAILDRQFKAVAIQLTTETIPAFTVLFQEISTALTGSADGWRTWANVVETELVGVVALLKSTLQFVASRGVLDFGVLFDANVDAILGQIRKLRGEALAEGAIGLGQRLLQASGAGRPGDKPDADKARAAAAARAAKDIQLQQQALEESTRVHRAELERERQLDLQSIDEWEDATIQSLFDHQKAQQAIFNEEARNIRLFVKEKADRLLEERELLQKRVKLNNDTLQNLQKVSDEAQKKRDQSELKLNSQLLAIEESRRQGQLAIIERALAKQEISEEGAAIRQLEILREAHEQRLTLITLELQQQTTSAERKTELDNEKLKSEQEYTKQVEELTQKRIEALIKEGAAGVPGPGGKPQAPSGTPIVPIDIGLPPPSDVDVFAEAIKHLKGIMEDFSTFTSETFVFAIDSLTDGIKEAARAWIIYGESIGKALRRALAETFATISAEALIQALLHAAYALGNLAFGNFAAAAKHGIAAAKFAAVAAAAGIAGRISAGSAFSSSGSGGSGGGSTGSGSGSSTTRQPQPVNLDRNTNRVVYVQPVVHVTVIGQATEGFKYMVEKANTDSYRDGGALNNIVRHAMGDPGFQV